MKIQDPKSLPSLLGLAVVAILIGMAFITPQSLWMDEGSSAFKALMPTFRDWWAMTQRIGGSDIQMPVYMFLLWLWHQAGAASEFALRAINLPWLVVAVLALRKVRFWPLVCLSSPFVLYYVGELRPYTMQIAAGALAAAALRKVIASRDGNGLDGLHASAGAALLLASSSLTAAVWAVGLWLGVLIIRPDWLRRGGFWLKLTPWIFGAITLGAYYLFTLMKGYRAAGLGDGGILSLFFGIYEMIGLLGLGPGRNELRASPAAALSSLPLLVPAFACILTAWILGVMAWVKSTPRQCVAGVACAVMAPILILAAVGVGMNFQVLGRHLSPVIPAVLLPIAISLSGAGNWRKSARVCAVLALCFAFISAVALRFHPRHARDDYRRATEIALKSLQDGKEVWWQADMNATRYYAYRKGGMPLINAIQILESKPPTSLMFADVVVINRPDLRYGKNDYQKELRRNFFELDAAFTGFEVWRNR